MSMMDALKKKLHQAKTPDMEHLGKADSDMIADQSKSDDDIAGPAPKLRGDDMHEGHVDLQENEPHEGKEHMMDTHHLLGSVMEGKENDDHNETNEGDAMKHGAISAIMNMGQHHGRGAMSLGERASDKAKEKFASIAKERKGKY